MEKAIVCIVSFFMYSGYYVGLSFFFVFGRAEQTLLYYSLPLRILLSVIMGYVIFKNFRFAKWPKVGTIAFLVFSYYYISKIMYSGMIGWSMSKNWFEFVGYYFIFVLIPYIFFSSISFDKYWKTILDALIFSGFLLGVISTYLFAEVLLSGSAGRISKWTFGDERSVISPLSLSYSGVLTILMCVYRFVYESNSFKVRVYLALVLVMALILFYLGASRGSVLALLLSVFAFVFFGSSKNRLKFLVALVLFVPISMYGAAQTGSSIFDRTLTTLEDGHTSGRTPLWDAAITEFLDNPLFGGVVEVSGVYPHNLFLEILMGTGAFGMVVFLIFLLSQIGRGFALSSQNNIYLIPLLIFICAFSQHMVSFALWGSMLFFQPLGIFNSRIRQ